MRIANILLEKKLFRLSRKFANCFAENISLDNYFLAEMRIANILQKIFR